ncbi:MAG: 4-alpha-glucanotransferase [Anaerolineae bacterium]
MSLRRSSGVLLHPTSFPGRFGIGGLGESAYDFVDFLADSGQQLWQVLPLGPTGYGDSPYQALSVFAGNPLLISLDELIREGALSPSDVEDAPQFPVDRVDYGEVIRFKMPALRRSFQRFTTCASSVQRGEFSEFCDANCNWLNDFALFMALKDNFGGIAWTAWDRDIAAREPEAIRHWTKELDSQIRFHQYLQFQFFRQWLALKHYANSRGIRIIGDMPIFAAHDSADTWSHPELFHLDEQGNPAVMAGVPPDHFSPAGQLWGNPLYRWDVLAQNSYAWWIARFHAAFQLLDIVRVDHFRGFEAYWVVPAGEETAVAGQWVKGPGMDLFGAVEHALGKLAIIAEDLGFVTPEVKTLLEATGFPGMQVLQFAFDTDASNGFLPHNYERNCIVYTGTHDNDTTRGWFESQPEDRRGTVLQYLGTDGSQIHWDFIRLAFGSVAYMAVVPLQDVLGLGSEARMNYPGRASGNWTWRYTADMLTDEIAERLGMLAAVYGRTAEETDGEPCPPSMIFSPTLTIQKPLVN